MIDSSKISTKYRRRAKAWLFMALALGVLWIVIWFGRDEEAQSTIQQKSTTIVNDTPLPTKIDHLVDFAKEVSPVSFEEIDVDLRTYSPEFKDKRFLEKNQDKWTVPIMDVEKHENIINYLDTRKDRHKFYYFRYLDSNKKEKYVLMYDIMSSYGEAHKVSKESFRFGLPATTILQPEEVRRYLTKIDNYEYEPEEKPSVTLNQTDKVVEAKLPKPEPAEPAQETFEETTEEPPRPKKPAEEPAQTKAEKPKEKPAQSPPKAEPAKETKKDDIAVPPTIQPNAEAQSQAQSVVPLNQAPPVIEGVE